MNVLTLTKDLLKLNTVNPPGNEEEAARFVGDLLLQNGFDIDYPKYKEGRLNLIATKGLNESIPPIVLTGHFDVVPLGAKEWSVEPFGAEVKDGKLFGRGSSDMKSGIAAMVIAVIEVFKEATASQGGVKLIFTADEELGCNGAKKLSESGYQIGAASAIIVGEPTSNNPYIGHKGGLYMNATTIGVTAHSSMPELGDNAIYKAAEAITKIANYRFNVEKDLLLGFPTINVGKINGGLNLNSVPDRAEFTIDIRSTTKLKNSDALNKLKEEIGSEVTIEELVNLNAISTSEDNKFVKMVYEICNFDNSKKDVKKSASFLTDASVLTPWLNNVPTIILGPGEPEMAHQTDEFCFVDKIEEAVKIYKEIINKYGNIN